jgi:hypothetical protein
MRESAFRLAVSGISMRWWDHLVVEMSRRVSEPRGKQSATKTVGTVARQS